MAEQASMRLPVTLGVSLKMYLDVPASVEWSRRVATIARNHSAVSEGAVELFVLPSLPAMSAVSSALTGSGVGLGAQDLHWEDRGAYTGAVSGADLHAIGCRFVEVGHAERRRFFGDDEVVVARKLAAAVRNGLTPVLCVGEERKQPAADAAADVVRQVESALAEVDARGRLVVAYEPQWAIGQPVAADPGHVSEVASALRRFLAGVGGFASASVIYGGSAQRGSVSALVGAVDGLFLGRFAHRTDDLARILDEAAAVA